MILQRSYHLSNKLAHILCMLHHSTRGAVRAYGKVSVEFDIITGVKRRDGLAPLFNIFFNAIIVTLLARRPHCSVKILYNLGGELVGNKKRVRGNVLVLDLMLIT